MRSFVNSCRFISEFRRTFIHAFMLSFLHAFLLAFSYAFLHAFLRAFKQAIINECEIHMRIHVTLIHLAVFIVVIKRGNCARIQQRHRREIPPTLTDRCLVLTWEMVASPMPLFFLSSRRPFCTSPSFHILYSLVQTFSVLFIDIG